MPFERHHYDLETLRRENRLRQLIPQAGIDFASNDYLGLGASHLLTEAAQVALERGVSVGSGGSRLLRGNQEEHEALEAEAATFFGSESALWFATGYAANSAILATLPQSDDLILYDELSHASTHEGLRLTRAKTSATPHNDANAISDEIRNWRVQGGTGRVWIAVESLYSMDGDRAPLANLAAIADMNDAVLIIDEAHATGVFGPDGRGLAASLEGRENVITLHTCGKALGCEGGLICAPRVVRDFLINRGRGFIFSTAPSPLMAAVVRAALRILRDQPERREKLWNLVASAEEVLAPLGIEPTGSQIIPIIIGDDAHTMKVAKTLQDAGFDVRGIRPPTVPEGASRLRLSLTLNATETDIREMALVLRKALS